MSDFDHVYEPGSTGWTLVLLHGTGGDKTDLVSLGQRLAPGATILSPSGKEMENGVTRRFFKRHSALDLDIPDLLEATDDMAGFISTRTTANGLDPDRLLAIGLSNGANLIASLLMRHAGLLKGAVMLRPTLPYRPEETPVLAGTEVFIASGGQDPYVPDGLSQDLADLLSEGGAKVAFNMNEAAGHGLSQEDLQATAVWMDELMNGDAD